MKQNLEMESQEIKNLSLALSDVLCFISGWEAAKGELPDALFDFRRLGQKFNSKLKEMKWE